MDLIADNERHVFSGEFGKRPQIRYRMRYADRFVQVAQDLSVHATRDPAPAIPQRLDQVSRHYSEKFGGKAGIPVENGARRGRLVSSSRRGANPSAAGDAGRIGVPRESAPAPPSQTRESS